MKEYMNEPVDFSWSDADIVEAYSGCLNQLRTSPF